MKINNTGGIIVVVLIVFISLVVGLNPGQDAHNPITTSREDSLEQKIDSTLLELIKVSDKPRPDPGSTYIEDSSKTRSSPEVNRLKKEQNLERKILESSGNERSDFASEYLETVSSSLEMEYEQIEDSELRDVLSNLNSRFPKELRDLTQETLIELNKEAEKAKNKIKKKILLLSEQEQKLNYEVNLLDEKLKKNKPNTIRWKMNNAKKAELVNNLKKVQKSKKAWRQGFKWLGRLTKSLGFAARIFPIVNIGLTVYSIVSIAIEISESINEEKEKEKDKEKKKEIIRFAHKQKCFDPLSKLFTEEELKYYEQSQSAPNSISLIDRNVLHRFEEAGYKILKADYKKGDNGKLPVNFIIITDGYNCVLLVENLNRTTTINFIDVANKKDFLNKVPDLTLDIFFNISANNENNSRYMLKLKDKNNKTDYILAENRDGTWHFVQNQKL